MTIPLLIPICFDFLPRIAHKKIVIYSIGIILLIRVVTIIHTSHIFEDRHDWMLTTIENNDSKKSYINRGDAPNEMLIQVWTAPEETLLLTSLNGPNESASLLIKRSDYKYMSELDSTDMFMRTHSAQPFDELNSRYFNLGNDSYKEATDLSSER